jgi:hypothetical protein
MKIYTYKSYDIYIIYYVHLLPREKWPQNFQKVLITQNICWKSSRKHEQVRTIEGSDGRFFDRRSFFRVGGKRRTNNHHLYRFNIVEIGAIQAQQFGHQPQYLFLFRTEN